MTFKTFKSVTAIALALGYSVVSLAQGGDDPISGIDIIMKEDPSLAPVMNVGFTPDQLKKINSVKDMDRPSYMAMIGAQYAHKATKGAQPKGGWEDVFKQALIKNWNPEERGGSTTLGAQTGEQAYKVTFTVQAEGGAKYIGETEKNLNRASPQTPTPAEVIKMLEGSKTISNEQFASLMNKSQPHWETIEQLARTNNIEAKSRTAIFIRDVEDSFPNDKIKYLEGGSGLIIALLAIRDTDGNSGDDRKKAISQRLGEALPNDKIEYLEGGSGLIIALLAAAAPTPDGTLPAATRYERTKPKRPAPRMQRR